MVHRLVSKSEASTPEAAVEFIRQDTGGAVMHASGFPVIDEGDHWRIPVFSLDGHGAMPFPVGAVFPVDQRVSDGEIDRQVHQFDLKERPEFESKGGDGPGWELGRATGPGFVKTGRIEDEQALRNADPDQTSWTPGIATGDDFTKQ
jgi:hypothetical protein